MLEKVETRDISSIVIGVSHCKGETRRDISRKCTNEELTIAQTQMANDHDRVIHLNKDRPCHKEYYVV